MNLQLVYRYYLSLSSLKKQTKLIKQKQNDTLRAEATFSRFELACEKQLTFRTPAHTAKMQPLLAGYLLTASYCIYMRRITIQQQQTFLFLFNKGAFHFRMIFPKKLRLGVLQWGREKSKKNRETDLGSRRAIADLLILFFAWTSQKASKVHKRLSQSWPQCHNIPSPHEGNSSYESYNIITSKALGTLHARHFIWERSINYIDQLYRATSIITKYVYI